MPVITRMKTETVAFDFELKENKLKDGTDFSLNGYELISCFVTQCL